VPALVRPPSARPPPRLRLINSPCNLSSEKPCTSLGSAPGFRPPVRRGPTARPIPQNGSGFQPLGLLWNLTWGGAQAGTHRPLALSGSHFRRLQPGTPNLLPSRVLRQDSDSGSVLGGRLAEAEISEILCEISEVVEREVVSRIAPISRHGSYNGGHDRSCCPNRSWFFVLVLRSGLRDDGLITEMRVHEIPEDTKPEGLRVSAPHPMGA